MPRVRLRLIATLLAVTLLPALAIRFAAAQHSGVDSYAITNARIVPVSGALIERGTIVFRNGLIVAVGANVSAPSDARVIDGTGLTVYPGLIDSYTNLALPEASPAPSVGGGAVAVGFSFCNKLLHHARVDETRQSHQDCNRKPWLKT